MKKHVGQDDDLAFEAKDDPKPLLPDDRTYEVSCLRYEKYRYVGGGYKLYVIFEIVDLGSEHHGKRLFKVYNVYQPPRRGSDLFKDLERLYGKRASKGTRLSPALFLNKILTIKLRTVKENYKGTELPEFQWYSVIDQIIGIAAGSPGGAR